MSLLAPSAVHVLPVTINWGYSAPIQNPLWWQCGKWFSILFYKDIETILNSVKHCLCWQGSLSLSQQNQFKLITAHLHLCVQCILELWDSLCVFVSSIIQPRMDKFFKFFSCFFSQVSWSPIGDFCRNFSC